MSEPDPTTATVHDRVGGQRFFDDLVARFYAAVDTDPVLRPMYPEDLSESRRTLAGFLAQYWGGPPLYSEERGHPRLRMRHNPFTIGQVERDHWLAHMSDAIRASDLPEDIEAAMLEYSEMASSAMINSPIRFAPRPTPEGP
ncbi:MAG: globin domain-containing protein [Acidimicrobiales bacterium]